MLLNVSSYAVHKNLETVVEALPELRERDPRVKLVTTTSRSHTTNVEEYDVLKRRARELNVDDAWIEIGYLPHSNLLELYQAADVFVFPSLTESFGLPMVEAMAAGLPIVAAGTDVNREVCGAAGHYFETFEAIDCARSIHDVLEEAICYTIDHSPRRRRDLHVFVPKSLIQWEIPGYGHGSKSPYPAV
jgi:glycosyltransferase involved in cell wall biosynthesis